MTNSPPPPPPAPFPWPATRTELEKRIEVLEEFAAEVLEDFWRHEYITEQVLGAKYGLLKECPTHSPGFNDADCPCWGFAEFGGLLYKYSPEIQRALQRLPIDRVKLR